MSKSFCERLGSRFLFAVSMVLGTALVEPVSPAKAGSLTLTSVSNSGSFGLYYTTTGSNGLPGFSSSGMLTSTGSSLFPALTGSRGR